MTDDPEITDPRDPYKQRDIVAELDCWLADNGMAIKITSWTMIKRAHVEILKLRQAMTHDSAAIATLCNHARDEALEEAAQVCSLMEDRDNFDCAAAIRALKRLRGN